MSRADVLRAWKEEYRLSPNGAERAALPDQPAELVGHSEHDPDGLAGSSRLHLVPRDGNRSVDLFQSTNEGEIS